MKFTIILEPKGQKRARGRAFLVGGKAIAGKPRKDEEQLLEEEKLLTLMYAHRPPEPLQGPLMLGIKAYPRSPRASPRNGRPRPWLVKSGPPPSRTWTTASRTSRTCAKASFGWMTSRS